MAVLMSTLMLRITKLLQSGWRCCRGSKVVSVVTIKKQYGKCIEVPKQPNNGYRLTES